MKSDEARGWVSKPHFTPRPETEPLPALSTMGGLWDHSTPCQSPGSHTSPTPRLWAGRAGEEEADDRVFCVAKGLLQTPE